MTARRTTVVVVGAGHNGLAIGRRLAERSIDHVILERGQVAHSWHTQRWDSLRLLTPNWMTRLPGFDYDGDDPDGYLSAPEVASLIGKYAVGAPVQTDTEVTAVRAADGGFVVDTSQGPWHARAVVLAAGITTAPPPPVAAALPGEVTSVSTLDYKRPDQLPDGGVLVVGAGASGVQIAEELQLSGRPVTLSTGEHVRVPRRYRGRDILWWLDHVGILDERAEDIDDVLRARHLPSFQLIGAGRDVDLASLQALGVAVVGKLGGVRDGVAQLSGSLPNVIALADLKLNRLLNAIDDVAGGHGERPEPTVAPKAPLLLDLRRNGIRSVVWATGIKPDYSWVDLPVFDHKGGIRHDGGVVDWPGLYVTGLPVLRRRRSTFIDGAAADSAAIVDHLAGFLAD